MSGISTHVLDLAVGRPAAGVGVRLLRLESGSWTEIAASNTDADGRCRELLSGEGTVAAEYRIVFDTGAYFEQLGAVSLYPEVAITFRLEQLGTSYHMPLLLSPNGYTTYRGS